MDGGALQKKCAVGQPGEVGETEGKGESMPQCTLQRYGWRQQQDVKRCIMSCLDRQRTIFRQQHVYLRMHNLFFDFLRRWMERKDSALRQTRQRKYRTFEDKCLVEPGGENEQLFHPTITTGIAPMAVLIYMNAAIFAGESTQRGFMSCAD